MWILSNGPSDKVYVRVLLEEVYVRVLLEEVYVRVLLEEVYVRVLFVVVWLLLSSERVRCLLLLG